MPRFEAWSETRAGEIITRHVKEDGAALPILHALQETFGHIPPEAVRLVAAALNLSRAEMHGIVTFYHDFREHPPGSHVLKLCRAEACQSMGGNRLADHARAKLRVDWHGTTANNGITLEPVFCLGLCACAPSAMLDGQVFGRVDDKRLDALIDQAERS